MDFLNKFYWFLNKIKLQKSEIEKKNMKKKKKSESGLW